MLAYSGLACLTLERRHRGLVSYHFGNLQWAIAHVASLFGAYFAGVLIYAFSAENNSTSASRNRTWLVSFLFSFPKCILSDRA